MREADHIAAFLVHRLDLIVFVLGALARHLVTKPAVRRRSCQRVWDVKPLAHIEFAMPNAIIGAGAPLCGYQNLTVR